MWMPERRTMYGGNPIRGAPALLLVAVRSLERRESSKAATHSTRLPSFSVIFMAVTTAAARSAGAAVGSHAFVEARTESTQLGNCMIIAAPGLASAAAATAANDGERRLVLAMLSVDCRREGTAMSPCRRRRQARLKHFELQLQFSRTHTAIYPAFSTCARRAGPRESPQVQAEHLRSQTDKGKLQGSVTRHATNVGDEDKLWPALGGQTLLHTLFLSPCGDISRNDELDLLDRLPHTCECPSYMIVRDIGRLHAKVLRSHRRVAHCHRPT